MILLDILVKIKNCFGVGDSLNINLIIKMIIFLVKDIFLNVVIFVLFKYFWKIFGEICKWKKNNFMCIFYIICMYDVFVCCVRLLLKYNCSLWIEINR